MKDLAALNKAEFEINATAIGGEMDPIWPRNFQPDVIRDGFGSKLSTYTLALEAWRRGLTVTFAHLNLSRMRISQEAATSVNFIGARPDMTTLSGHRTAKNKYRTIELLTDAGIAAPKSVLIDPQRVSTSELMGHADRLGYPVVLKPRNGAMGDGVFANIEDSSVLEKRFDQLVRRSPAPMLVLESHVRGDDYRVLVYGGQYIAAARRVPANISGDGKSTVNELIRQKNAHRRKNPFLSKGLIKKDQEITDYLARYGYDDHSVPAAGEYIQLRAAANASAGGDIVDVTDHLPASIRESAIRAVQVVPGLFCAGVDVLYEDSPENVNVDHAVLELNSQPQIGVNMYPTQGAGVDVPSRVMDVCFPDSVNPRQPGDEKLALRLKPSLRPLASGHVAEVTMNPLPSSRYSVRRLFDLSERPTLSERERASILRASRAHSVAGFIRMRGGRPQIMAAGTQTQITEFIDSVASTLGSGPMNPRAWHRAVFAGFVIDI